MLDPKSLVLIAIDFQPPFISICENKATFLKRAQFSIEAADLLDIPIIFSEQNPDRLEGTEPSTLKLAHNAKVFPKTAFSIFGDTAISEHLKSLKRKHLLIIGLDLSICVYQTCRDALQQNYTPILLHDAIGGQNYSRDKTPIYTDLVNRCTQVLPSETVFYSLLQDANHPKFKAYLNIAKRYAS